MAKEMSHDLNDETTEDVASKVLTTKRPAAQLASAGQRAADEAPLKSGVGKIEIGTHTKNQVPRPVPVPPRARARIPAPAAPEPRPTTDSDVSESEKTQVYRPSTPPVVRASARPTVRPAPEALLANQPVSVPKPPRMPDAIPGMQRGAAVKTSQFNVQESPEEDRTRVCPAAVIEGLLKKDDGAGRDSLRTAADDVTRVGEIPIEELVLAERQLAAANSAVGHEDVTRSYSFNLNDTPSQVTSPGKRQQRLEVQHEPLVIIQPDRPRRGRRLMLVGLLLLGACSVFAGWSYRSTLERYSRTWQASFLRGISAATNHRSEPRKPSAVVVPISISVSVSPADAVLTIDGTRVENPFVAQKPPDKLSHELRVEAPGHVSLNRRLQFDRDLTVVLALAPIPVTQSPPPEVAKEPEPSPPSGKATLMAKATPRVRTQKSSEVKPPAAPESGQSNCSPPYLIDSKGIKAFKPECL